MVLRRLGVKLARRALKAAVTPPASVVGIQGLVNAGFRAAAMATIQPAIDNIASPLVDDSGRGQFAPYHYAGPLGSLESKLYQPAETQIGARPALIVMLHGCSQSVDSFALGTQMNQQADRHHCLVLYPAQPRNNNPAKCWNWFRTSNQRRNSDESGLIAAATREVIEQFGVDPKRVYVAGLSAGGAMAATMIELYPELYAASGIHSGLPARAAHSVTSAMRAMEVGANLELMTPPETSANSLRPMIVFHGESDTTVHPSNSDALMHAYLGPLATTAQTSAVIGGRAVMRTDVNSKSRRIAEKWLIKGAGHAWSGGDASGSYADKEGPSASAEMLRFFFEHPMPS